ncbi:Immunity protein 51 [Chitinophaga costaii]|uniref:Immunity protein 51 n=1 Tax=Chitinophaga costaii TaxID=1335309 RepID=A0A1C3YYH1_9BACT|nr:Imm51 family immunity protein [Chitinophaga costaii]PUZ30156.1 hypothetical protein DCM91_01395 [Chitinophaga costaii]SCB75156.1 Immunity protein 51 [Chitinophaga costaii]
MANYFPFTISDYKGTFGIVAAVESPELNSRYFNIFSKYNYEGNGFAWEGIIKQILEKLAPDLLTHVEYDTLEGGFYAYADSKDTQLRILDVLVPVFNDDQVLEDYLSQADPSQMTAGA